MKRIGAIQFGVSWRSRSRLWHNICNTGIWHNISDTGIHTVISLGADTWELNTRTTLIVSWGYFEPAVHPLNPLGCLCHLTKHHYNPGSSWRIQPCMISYIRINNIGAIDPVQEVSWRYGHKGRTGGKVGQCCRRNRWGNFRG